VPRKALENSAECISALDRFSEDQILENRLAAVMRGMGPQEAARVSA
jgi:hypothetical protein